VETSIAGQIEITSRRKGMDRRLVERWLSPELELRSVRLLTHVPQEGIQHPRAGYGMKTSASSCGAGLAAFCSGLKSGEKPAARRRLQRKGLRDEMAKMRSNLDDWGGGGAGIT